MPDPLVDLVEYMARGLVDKPDEVHVTELEDEEGTVLELRVAPEDLGKVIGKAGRTARAMRLVLGAATAKSKRHATLEIVD